MEVKAQFNSSSGKVSYTSGTGKQQTVAIFPRCELCSQNIPRISVTLIDFVVQCCSSATLSRIWDSAMESVVNDTFILEAVSPCAWVKLIDLNVNLLQHTGIDCEDAPEEILYPNLQIRYSLFSAAEGAECTATLVVSAYGGGNPTITVVSGAIHGSPCEFAINFLCLPAGPLVFNTNCNYFTAIRLIDGSATFGIP